MDLWKAVLPPKAYKVLELVVHLIGFAALCVFFKYSLHLTALAGMTKMTGSRLPLTYLYLAEPVGIGMLIVAMAGRLGEIIAGK